VRALPALLQPRPGDGSNRPPAARAWPSNRLSNISLILSGMQINDFDPIYLPDDGFPRERPAEKKALEMAPIDWSMHQPDEDDAPYDPPDIGGPFPPFPPYSYASIRRALEDGTYEITSVEVEGLDRP
jgi:hypothetical protein